MSDRILHSGDAIWVTSVIDRGRRWLPGGPTTRALVTLGSVPVALTVIFFLLSPQSATPSFVFAQVSATAVVVLGTVFIRYYDQEVLPSFAEQAAPIVVEDGTLREVVTRYEKFFREKYWIVSGLWAGSLGVTVLANVDFFRAQGLSGYLDPAFAVYLLFMAWFGIITGIGLHMVVTTIRCIRAVGDLELDIAPLHPDGLGGLGIIGDFAIKTTMMNSIGALVFPLAFAIANRGQYESLVYGAVGVYVVFILFSFLYPTIRVNRRAEAVREVELEKRRRQIREIRDETPSEATGVSGEREALERQLVLQSLQKEFDEYRQVNLYPLTISIFSRLISSVLLPVLFILIETYVISG